MTIETELPAVKVGDGMAFFTANVDRWGAAEWFDRLAKAIREQDNAVRAKDDISFEIFRSIAASSAMTLVREFEEQIRSALTLKDEPAGGSLSARMKAAGMYSIEEMLAEGKPIDKWMASTEVQDLPSFEAWLLRRYREFVTMQARYKLGDKDKGDELYEWVNAHVGSFADVLANFRAALRKGSEADGE
jgi:hypothetical protein